MFFNDLYSDVAKRFKNWLETDNESEYVDDLALDYANRAVKALLLEAPRGWTYLTIERYALTLSGLTATLPDNCGVLLRVYCDTTGTGKANVFYQREGNISRGFRFDTTFSLADGFEGSMTFFSAPEGTVYAAYQVTVDAFTGTEEDEYCPFPADLILLEAQRIRCREKQLTEQWQVISTEYESELAKFKGKHQNPVPAMNITINDALGYPIVQPPIGIMTNKTGMSRRGFSNSTDVVRY